MRPLRTALGLVLAAVLALSACGGGSSGPAAATKPTANGVEKLEAKAIVDKAQAAAKAAKSVHISGSATSDGQSFGIDMRVAGSQGATGTVTFSGSKIEVLRIGTDAYIKADRAFWSQLGDATIAAQLADKYVRGSTTDSQFSAFTDFTDITKIFDDLLKPSGTVQRVDGKPVNGVATVGVRDTDKSNGGVLYVATTGEPYPLLIEPDKSSGDTGSISLAEWNAPVRLTTPPASQVFELSNLGG
jgi:hypothetical protein